MSDNVKVSLRTACFWCLMGSAFDESFTAKDVLDWIANDKRYKADKPEDFDEWPDFETVEKILRKAAKSKHIYLLTGRRASRMSKGQSYFLRRYSFHTPK